MTALTNTAEGGSDGVAVVAGDTGSGDTFDIVLANTGNTITYATSAANKGSLGYAFSRGSTSNRCQVRWQPAAGTSQRNVVRWYLKMTSLPASLIAPLSWSNTAQSSNYCTIVLASTGKFTVLNNLSAQIGTAGADGWGNGTTASTGAITTGTWYRIEASIDNTGGTSAGVVILQVFAGDSLTPLSGLSFSTAGMTDASLNFGNNVAIGSAQWGAVSVVTEAISWSIDDLAWTTASTTFIGPSGSQSPPGQPRIYPSLAATQTASW